MACREDKEMGEKLTAVTRPDKGEYIIVVVLVAMLSATIILSAYMATIDCRQDKIPMIIEEER
jgi:hypothetical protein